MTTAAEYIGHATVKHETLLEHCTHLLARAGLPSEDSRITAAVCCQAELMGEVSHGVRLIPALVARVLEGGDQAVTRIDVVRDFGAMASWDANSGVGQVAAARAMDTAIEKAREFGLGFVAVRNSGSITSARYYALQAARSGMIGVALTSTTRKMMPPEGGKDPVLGSNPVAYAAPGGTRGPFLLDMACTVAAIERIQRAAERGEQIPIGWALDSEGNDTTDAQLALNSMTLLPFGGYKAFGLGMVHEILTAVLSGGLLKGFETTGFQPYDKPMRTSFTVLAIDVSKFMPIEIFIERMEEFTALVKSSRPRGEDAVVLTPGERSNLEQRRRLDAGVPLSVDTIEALAKLAAYLGVSPLFLELE